MNFRKNSKGITLIALVVTIIVLLILAGVSLSLVAGSNGIITKATKAADANAVATAKEQVTLQIAELTTEFYDRVYVQKDVDVNKKAGDWIYDEHHASEANPNLTTDEYRFIIESAPSNDTDNKGNAKYRVRVLKQYGAPLKTEERIKEDIKGYLTQDGILSWASSGSTTGGSTPETPTYTAYTRGQTVTVKNKDGVEQSFYVLNDSSSSEATVTLLAAKNIKTSTLLQGDDANTIAFSANSGWAAGENLNDYGNLKIDGSSAVYYAVQYGGKFEGATGRLMTVGEVKDITGLTGAGAISSPDWIKTTTYWLGSADDARYVWDVHGLFGGLYRVGFDLGSSCGVRPVIEISKSLIQE